MKEINCGTCQQTFLGTPTNGGLCPLCGGSTASYCQSCDRECQGLSPGESCPICGGYLSSIVSQENASLTKKIQAPHTLVQKQANQNVSHEAATNTEAVKIVNNESLPKIQAVARNGAVQSATGSLAAWGAINVGVWFLMGSENRTFLSGLSHNPSNGILFIIYGGLVLGAVMLAFSALGSATGSVSTILLSGLSLICVGLWNVTNDFIAIEALKPYGYTIEKPSVFWIVLGISQIIWGLREFSIFGRIESWNIPNLTGHDLAPLKEKLQTFVQMADDMEQRIIKGSITTNGPLGLGFLSNTTAYTGVLLHDRAIIVSDGLDDCFSVDKISMNGTAFETDSAVQFLAEDGERNMVLTPLSVITFKTWLGQTLKPDDIQCAASNNTLNFSMIKPWLSSENPELRAASVAALADITDDNAAKVAASITDDPDLDVQIAAIDACAKLKSIDLMDKTVHYLASPINRFRSATAKYLCAMEQPSAVPTLKNALSKETNRTVKRELKRALQAAQKN